MLTYVVYMYIEMAYGKRVCRYLDKDDRMDE